MASRLLISAQGLGDLPEPSPCFTYGPSLPRQRLGMQYGLMKGLFSGEMGQKKTGI
jgi:hypothetical protein